MGVFYTPLHFTGPSALVPAYRIRPLILHAAVAPTPDPSPALRERGIGLAVKVGPPEAVRMAVENDRQIRRYTALAERIVQSSTP